MTTLDDKLKTAKVLFPDTIWYAGYELCRIMVIDERLDPNWDSVSGIWTHNGFYHAWYK